MCEETISTFAEQAPAMAALASMTAAFGDLPDAYITVHRPTEYGSDLAIQLDDAHGFDLWRCALRIPPSAVELQTNGRNSWLEASGSFSGVAVYLSGWGIPTCAPRDPAARLAEQRHQLEDPAMEAAFATLAAAHPERCTPAGVTA